MDTAASTATAAAVAAAAAAGAMRRKATDGTSVHLDTVRDKNVAQLRRLNAAIFPVKYQDKYYADAMASSEYTRLGMKRMERQWLWPGWECSIGVRDQPTDRPPPPCEGSNRLPVLEALVCLDLLSGSSCVCTQDEPEKV